MTVSREVRDRLATLAATDASISAVCWVRKRILSGLLADLEKLADAMRALVAAASTRSNIEEYDAGLAVAEAALAEYDGATETAP